MKWVMGDMASRIGVVAVHCTKMLGRVCRSGPRGKVPSVAEIERAQVCN
jgi:hypothetical protein